MARLDPAIHVFEMGEKSMGAELSIHIAEDGRMVLPRAERDALSVKGAGVVVLSVEGDEVKLSPMSKSIERAQALYRAHATSDRSSAAFLEERRAEAEADNKTDR